MCRSKRKMGRLKFRSALKAWKFGGERVVLTSSLSLCNEGNRVSPPPWRILGQGTTLALLSALPIIKH